ncbi:MAG: LamG-like jellyroll fold domain-containing protein [Caldilineaceae bacterium]
MLNKSRKPTHLYLGLMVIGLLALTIALAAQPALADVLPQSAYQRLQAAWQRAGAIGQYNYHSTILQTTTPATTLRNAGRTPQTQRIRVDGSLDKAADVTQMELQIGQRAPIGIKIEDGQAYGRQGVNEEWTKVDQMPDLFAPGGDPLGFLVAMEKVRELGPNETGMEDISAPAALLAAHYSADEGVTRYAFDLSGPKFAQLMKAQMEAELRRKGELPPSMSLSSAGQYAAMSGHGELWIGADGLPLHLLVQVSLPPQSSGADAATADISTAFSGWAAPTDGGWSLFWRDPTQIFSQPTAVTGISGHMAQQIGLTLGLTLLVLGCGALALTHRRRWSVRAVVYSLIILSMVITPLLQTQQASAFYDGQQARAQEAAAANVESNAASNVASSAFNPHENPVQVAMAKSAQQSATLQTTNAAVDTAMPAANAAQIATECTVTETSDCDGDGLTDQIEIYQLGTLVNAVDTDGDGISDKAEIQPFTVGGQSWYLDPRSSDSNGDGFTDAMECSVRVDVVLTEYFATDTYATCPDTDGDGVPDVFDFDNDGDGVPDNIDSAPNAAQTVTDKQFGFALAGYAADRSLTVNLELRPTDDRHLWWNDNALDWPEQDVEGQVQRVTDETIRGDGDMRLSPMLEVAIPYAAANPTRGLPVRAGVTAAAVGKNTPVSEWLDQEQLDAYGIVVSGPRAEDGLIYLYAPLTTIRDEMGDTPVAFGATLFYEMASGAGGWGANHQMRLLWIVNGLNDSCEAPTDLSANAAKAYCADYANWISKQTVFQTYYDDFRVTGLTVEQDLGASALMIAQKETSTAYESDLWHLLDTLQDTYLDAQTVNGQRLTLSQIPDHLSAWGINSGNLYMQSFSDLQDKIALAKALTGDAIITTLSQLHPNPAPEATANLLFVGETTTTDAALGTTAMTFSANTLRVNLAGLDQETTGFVRWNPYHYAVTTYPTSVTDPERGTTAVIYNQTERWDELNVATYAEQLQRNLATVLTKDVLVNAGLTTATDDAELVSSGAALLATNYYLANYIGAPATLENSRFTLTGDPLVDSDHVKSAEPVLTIVARLLAQLQQSFAQQSLANLTIETDASGAQLVANTTWQTLAASPGAILAGIGALIAGDTASSVTIALATVTGPPTPTTRLTGTGLSDAATLAFTGKDFSATWANVGTEAGIETGRLIVNTRAYTKFVTGQRMHDFWDEAARDLVIGGGNPDTIQAYRVEAEQGQYQAVKVQRNVDFWATVGVAAEIATIAIFTTYTILTQHLEPGSPAFHQALVMAYAQAVTALVTFAITVVFAAIPGVNLVLAAILVIDAIIAIACTATGVKQETTQDVGYWLCGGVSGALTKALVYALNDNTLLMDVARADHLDVAFQAPTVAATGGTDGLIVGNTLQMTATITNTAYAGHPNWMGYLYAWQLDDDNVKQSAVDVRLQAGAQDFDGALKLGGTDWQRPDNLTFDDNPPNDGPRFVRSYQRSLAYTMDQPGVNVGLPYYLSEAMKVKQQDCWLYIGPPLWVPIPICQTEETFHDTFHQNLADFFIMDIFPASLNDFHTLAQDEPGQPGYRLAWDATFPVLRDADGDGLVSQAFNGPDPDDSNADTDGDGLSDFYEYQNGLDATAADGDCDGLTDYWELFYHTNPKLADSDHDGLPDGREFFHPNRQYPYENSVLSNTNAPACAAENGLTGPYAGGWSMVYAFNGDTPLRYWVSADPNNPDSDNDGLTDRSEQVYGYNPHAPSELDVLALETTVQPSSGLDAYVGLDGSIDYAATIINHLSDRYLRGLLESELPTDSIIKTQEIDLLTPLSAATLTGNVSVAAAGISASTATSMTLRAGVNVDDAVDNGQSLWLHLNEAPGATTFEDASLNGHDLSCTTCPTATGSALQFSADGQYFLLDPASFDLNAFSVGVWVKQVGSSGQFNPLRVRSTQSTTTIAEIQWDAGRGRVSSAVRSNNIATGLSDDFNNRPGLWKHLMLTYDRATQTMNFYVNGVSVGSRTNAVQIDTNPANLRLEVGRLAPDINPEISSVFEMDEFEFYPRVLDAQTILNRYGKAPLQFALTGTGNGVSCGGGRCPTLSSDGATFDQTKHLTLDTSGLSFSNNQFSIAVNVNPQQRPHPFNGEAGSHFGIDTSQDWQGVYGFQAPNNAKLIFPSLYVGSKGALRVDMGDGANTCSYQTADGLVAFGVDQQIAVSYDGSAFTVYINGEKKASGAPGACVGVQIPAVNQLYAGRPNNAGYFYWDQAEYRYLNDAGGTAEICLDFDDNSTGGAIWHNFNEDHVNGEWQKRMEQLDVPKRITDDAAHWFRFHEDDSTTTNCNYSTAANDDELVYKSGLTNVTTLGSFQNDFTDCFDCDQGTIYWSLSNEFFVGTLRNLQIFNYALSPQGAARAYNTETFALQMDFDEAPGATTLSDSSGNYFTAGCAGASCPDSGIPGRDNQALRFDGGVADDDGNDGVADYLTLPATDAALGFESGSFTIMAWVKPDSVSSRWQRIIGAGKAKSINGVGFGLREGQLAFTTFGIKDYISTASTPAGVWTHVAVSFNSDHDATFFVNGEEVGTVNGSVAAALNADDAYTIGALIAQDGSVTEPFDGLIDDLRILRFAADAGAIQTIMNEAPLLNLHLDEDIAITTFVNDASTTADGVCNLLTFTCPGAGDKGAMRESATFDGLKNGIYVADSDALDLDAFTVVLWVKPTALRTVGQFLLDKGVGSSRNYGLYLLPNSLQVTYSIASGCTDIKSTTSQGALLQNQWNHVVMTYDGAQARLYLNGSLDGSVLNVTNPCHNTSLLQIGNTFRGNLDEITIESGVRSAEQVAALYDYQSAWYDKKQQHTILVDADAPTVSVALGSAFIEPGQVLYINAEDPVVNGVASGLASVQYSIDGGAFADAAVDTNAYLIPATATENLGEGSHTVQVRATDNVGLSSANSQVSAAAAGATQTIQVDATAPNPGPGVIMPDKLIQPNRGRFNLYGRATDDGGAVQSGIDSSSVQATLRDHKGTLVSGPVAASFIAGPQWQSTHDLGVAPYGQYTFAATARDLAGNEGSASDTIWVDGLPSYGDMLIDTNVITGAGTVIGGLASDIPYPQAARIAHYHFEEEAGATLFYDGSANHLNAACTGSSCPTAGTGGQNDSAASFGGDDYLVINGQEGVSAATVLDLNGDFTVMAWINPTGIGGKQQVLAAEQTASSGGIGFGIDGDKLMLTAYGVKEYVSTQSTGIVAGAWSHVAVSYNAATNDMIFYINGVLLETVSGDDDLLINTDDGYRIGEGFTGAIDELVVYGTNLSEEAIYDVVNPVPANTSQIKVRYRHAGGVVWPNLDPDGLALYLPLDDGFGSDSFVDLSVYGRDATCGEGQCPLAAQNNGLQSVETGSFVEFDGTDDYLTVPNVLNPAAGSFSAAAWFNVSPLSNGNRYILQQADGNGVGRTWFMVLGNGTLRSFLGNSALDHPTKVTMNAWHHAVLTYDQPTQTLTLYLDGVAVSTTRALEASAGEMLVGVSKAKSGYFKGNIDEVAIFDRALSATEIGYLGQSPWYDASPVYESLDSGDTLGADDRLRPWSHTVPTGLEGPYKIDLLVSDGPVPAHREGVSQGVWTGIIDTSAPRLTFAYTRDASSGNAQVRCTAVDDYLTETGWSCPVDDSHRTASYQDAAWYTTRLTDTQQLVGLTTALETVVAEPNPTMSACDLFGNCRSTGDGGDTPVADNDADNVPDTIEDGAPNGGDGNGDGVPDSQQANVTSLPDASGTAGTYVTLAAPDGAELAAVSIQADAPAATPAGVSFPIGHLDFSVQNVPVGGATTVTLFVQNATRFNTYYKYGATADDGNDHWYEFLYDGSTGAEFLTDRIVLHFVDGGRGDADLTANGVIVDPGAPAFFLSATEMPYSIFLPLVGKGAQPQAQAVASDTVEQPEQLPAEPNPIIQPAAQQGTEPDAASTVDELDVTLQPGELTHKVLLPLMMQD